MRSRRAIAVSAIITAPTSVPSKAKVCTPIVIVRADCGRTELNNNPAISTVAITLPRWPLCGAHSLKAASATNMPVCFTNPEQLVVVMTPVAHPETGVREVLRIMYTTPCNVGGKRALWRCPGCSAQRATLFEPGAGRLEVAAIGRILPETRRPVAVVCSSAIPLAVEVCGEPERLNTSETATQTVLVVEDEVFIRMVISDYL